MTDAELINLAYRELAAAIVNQAIIDAQNGDIEARLWLFTPAALFLMESLGFEITEIQHTHLTAYQTGKTRRKITPYQLIPTN